MALCKPAATELNSKKRSRIAHGVFYTDPFFDLNFDFHLILIVP